MSFHARNTVDFKEELESFLDSIEPAASSPTVTVTAPPSNKRARKPTTKASQCKKDKAKKPKEGDSESEKAKQKLAQSTSLQDMTNAIIKSAAPATLRGRALGVSAKSIKLEELEDELQDARDALAAKKSQVLRLQTELGKTCTEFFM